MSGVHHPTLLLLAGALSGRRVRIPGSSRRIAGQLLELAEYHGVTQILAERVYKGVVDGLPEDCVKFLNASSRSHAAYDFVLNKSTKKTLILLAKNQIPVLLLKGMPVALQYYEHSYLRTRSDTDIFIRESDVGKAASLLVANGYQVSDLAERTHASKQFSATEISMPGAEVVFDIHWKLSNRILFNNVLQFEESWNTRQPLNTLGSTANTLSPIHLLLHACVHRIAHGRNTERSRLAWLYDIHLITSTFSRDEFQQFEDLAIKKQVGFLCCDGLVMCQYYFNTIYPSGYITALAKKHRTEPSASLLHASKHRWALADLVALSSTRERLSFAKELLFPSTLAFRNGFTSKLKLWIAHMISRVL